MFAITLWSVEICFRLVHLVGQEQQYPNLGVTSNCADIPVRSNAAHSSINIHGKKQL